MKKYPHTIKRTILKIGAVVIMAAVTLTSLFGCSQKDDIAGTVKKNLETKYHEKFVVSKVNGGSFVPTNVFADSYKLICYPEKDPSLKFKAELSPNGVFYDAYVCANVNVKVEKLINDALRKEFPNVIVKSVGDYLDSTNKNMSIEEYLNENKSGLLIYILIQTDKTKAKDIYNILQTTMKSVKNFNSSTYCFCVNQEDFNSGKKVFETNMDIEPKDFEKKYGSIEDASFGFEKNSMSVTLEEFITQFDKLGKWD